MIQLNGTSETRVLVAANFSGATCPENAKVWNLDGSILLLRHPKSGLTTSYAFLNNSLQELHWFKQSYGSWFLGNYVSEDGGLYTATTVDPVFILLPIFEEARMKKENDPGKFRKLDEIMFIEGFPGYQHLLAIAEDCMQVVCEVKEIGSMKFYRLDDSKVVALLCHKVDRLKLTLETLDKNYANCGTKDSLIDAVSLVGEYLKDDPWMHLLCNQLRLDVQQVARHANSHETVLFALENPPEPAHPLQVKDRKEKIPSSSRKQSKRAKAEVASLNIKDMFRKASK